MMDEAIEKGWFDDPENPSHQGLANQGWRAILQDSSRVVPVARILGNTLLVRLWFTDHANHSDISKQKQTTHRMSFIGVLRQVLQDLAAWVEDGGRRIIVAADEAFRLRADIEVPPGTGSLIVVEWDLDGSGNFATPGSFMGSGD